MRILTTIKLILSIVLFLGNCSGESWTCTAAENLPPEVSIVWPRADNHLSLIPVMKIKAQATDPDGTVTQVQFYVGTNMVGVATNPPYTILWFTYQADDGFPPWVFKAVAFDDQGAQTESAPVMVYYCVLCPPEPVVEIVAPHHGELFTAPAMLVFSAEVLASHGDAGPIEFFAGGNSLGVAGEAALLEPTTPPTSITVSNRAEGEYYLTVRYLGADGGGCNCNANSPTIRVVKLAVQSPRVNAGGQFEFEVLTSFPGRRTIIQASPDLMEWTSIHTNEPSSNSFWFTEPPRATNAHRFYRAWVPPE